MNQRKLLKELGLKQNGKIIDYYCGTLSKEEAEKIKDDGFDAIKGDFIFNILIRYKNNDNQQPRVGGRIQKIT